MSANYKFVDDANTKIASILELLQVHESREFIASELSKLVSVHALSDLINELPEDQRADYLKKVQGEDKEKHVLKLREIFSEKRIEDLYFTTFERVMNEFVSRAFPKIDSITLSKVKELLKA